MFSVLWLACRTSYFANLLQEIHAHIVLEMHPKIYMYNTLEHEYRNVIVSCTPWISHWLYWPLYFSCYKVEHPACHFYFLSIHTRLKACMSTEKIQVTCVILHRFHGIPNKSVTLLVCTHLYDQENKRIPVLASLEKSTCPGESIRFTMYSSSSKKE